MSRAGAIACAERMKTDQAFRDEIAGAVDDGARLELIKAAGFDVEASDRDAIVEALAHADAELNEAQLEGVTGGLVPGVEPMICPPKNY